MVKKYGLFELIKALSAAEKRYFIQSCRANNASHNYLRLFKEIDKMEKYDEAAIKKKFKGERFINQLHVIKIYLQESIYKSLRNYHASSSLSVQLKDLIKNVEICFDKELYNHCALEIAKAEKLARKYEDDITLIELLNWKRKLAQHHSPAEFNVVSIINDQAAALARITYQNKLWKHITQGTPADVPSDEVQATLASKVLTHHIRYQASIRNNQHKDARKNLEELLTILEQHPHRIQEEPSVYLSTINNLISFFVFIKEYDAALQAVAKAKRFYHQIAAIRRSKNNFRLILRTYNIELEIYRDTESLEKATGLIKETQILLTEHKSKAPAEYLISLWFQFAYVYFIKREFKDSLHWINEILNCSFADKRMDLYLQTHLLNLMVHLELRNFFVMGYFINSTKRFFKRNKALRPYHNILLTFFTKVSATPESEHKLLFEKLSMELFSDTHTVPKSDLDYIHWKNWVDEKLPPLKKKS